MNVTKDQMDQTIALEERLSQILDEEAKAGVFAKVPNADVGAAATRARLVGLKAIRHSMDFDGHAKAWDDANPAEGDR